MSQLTLIIGNKNYSSWSLRPWLYLKHSGIAFDEKRIALYQEDTASLLQTYSPSAKVPALRHGGVTIWDSLAICEYIAELFPLSRGWPQDIEARAIARAVSAEMHSGFNALRSELPMNIRKRFHDIKLSAAAGKDIDRILSIWAFCRERYGGDGPCLFGEFSIADAMFAPVVWRLDIYDIDVPATARAYMDSLLSLDSMRLWQQSALEELEVLEAFEVQAPSRA